jgi:hypothetical protein
MVLPERVRLDRDSQPADVAPELSFCPGTTRLVSIHLIELQRAGHRVYVCSCSAEADTTFIVYLPGTAIDTLAKISAFAQPESRACPCGSVMSRDSLFARD